MGIDLEYWAQEILRHVPLVTSVGLALALVLGAAWMTKRWSSAALLAMCCAAYAFTPFIPALH